jgi:biopolymer transport protein ExbD
MQHVIRIALTLLLTVSLSSAAWAKTAAKDAEYKRSDTNYYWKGDVLKVDPTAVIISDGKYTQKGGSYFINTNGKPPKEIYISVENDWIEPITPPTMPASLGVAPDAMQIREPQGDVTVALPTAPANFIPAQNNMAIPNGAVVKTGANGTAAVLMGGVDSIRLVPNSSAAVQQTVTPLLRSTEIDLTAGAVFSKVGKRIGEKQDYQVHTPFGVAAAKGTDFVTVAMPARTDVWIAQGTVQMDQPDGKLVGTVSSEGTGALKIIRNPPMPDMHAAMMASSETMTMAMDFIPTVNVYVKALDDKMAQGVKLTATERDYLNRIKKVPCLIKVALVEPPAPPPPTAPIAPPPAPAAPATTSTAAPTPVQIAIADDGSIQINGTPTAVDDLPARLADIAKADPKQLVLIIADDKVPHAQVKKVMGDCKVAKLTHVKHVKVAPPVPGAPTIISGPTAESPSTVIPAPTPAPAPAPAATPAAPAPPATPTQPPVLTPIDLNLRPDAKVDFQGETLTLDELKPKLQTVGKVTPLQPITVNGQENVKPSELKKVVGMLHMAKLHKVTIIPAAPKPTPPPMVAATPPPAPAPAPAAAPPAPAIPAAPLEIDVRADGKVDFQGGTFSLDDLKPKLEDIAKATPDQPIVVKRKEKLEKGQMKKVVELCHSAKLTKITVDRTPPPPATATTPPAPTPMAAPAPLPTETTPATTAPATETPPPSSPPPKPLPPAMLLPINLDLRPGGKVEIQGTKYTYADLKLRLEEIRLTTPTQPLVVVPEQKVTRAEVKKVVSLCLAAKLTDVTIAKAMPPTAPAVANGASPAPMATSSDVNAGSSTIASASSTSANLDSTNDEEKPFHVTKSHSTHVSATAAPISSGPDYTVP